MGVGVEGDHVVYDKVGDDDLTWWCWMVVLARGVDCGGTEG